MSLKLSRLSQGFVLNKPRGNNDPEDLRELQQKKDSQKQIKKKKPTKPKQANYDVYFYMSICLGHDAQLFGQTLFWIFL